ncbi:hypothetical protein ACLQ28_25210 [Micromonospora sp. DT201]|uniref:hypothetical protein n=1 Tax=Micromonospora sp. DT201 TaxID=3393442 RepID=UPI003CF724D4
MLAAEAPKITDWMQAWGSLAGLVMSTAAVIFTGLLFRHEIRVRREEKTDAESVQARLVVGTDIYLVPKQGQPDLFVEAGVKVVNYSNAPVLDLTVYHAHQTAIVSEIAKVSLLSEDSG